jgi:hypothetical protein
VADDHVARVQARELPGGGALGRTRKLDLHPLVLPGVQACGDAALVAAAMCAHTHSVDALGGAVQRDASGGDPFR